MRTLRVVAEYVMHSFQRLGRWLERSVTLDRALNIIGMLATVTLGILSIVVAFSQDFFWLITIISSALTILACLAIFFALRARRLRLLRVHELPYGVEESSIIVDIVDDDG